MTEQQIVFQGELQMLKWNESSTSGATVTFWVHPEDMDAFKTLKARSGKTAGQRLGVVMVAIGDDEAVVEHAPAPTPAPSAAPRYHKPVIGDNAMTAVRWCKSPVFRRWVGMVAPRMLSAHGDFRGALTEQHAKDFILIVCEVPGFIDGRASRKHLDANEHCAHLWHQRIRIPFREFLTSEGLEP